MNLVHECTVVWELREPSVFSLIFFYASNVSPPSVMELRPHQQMGWAQGKWGLGCAEL